jgi:BASS family bile acid:Na+ symporter
MSWVDWFVSGAMALIMFGIGSTLRVRAFRDVFVFPKPLLLGLILQLVFLPAFALLIAHLSGLPPILQVGLFIIAICPGGTSSNFISYISKADTALSISLTGVNSMFILLTIPLLTNYALNFFLEDDYTMRLSVFYTFLQVLVVVILPALLGVAFNHFMHRMSFRMKQPLKYLSVLLLIGVFTLKFFADEDSGGTGITKEDIFQILPSTLVLHLGSMLIAYIIARLVIRSMEQATTIGIEVGLQNTTLAILVTGTIIGNNDMTMPALVYALFSFFTTLIFAFLANYKPGRKYL